MTGSDFVQWDTASDLRSAGDGYELSVDVDIPAGRRYSSAVEDEIEEQCRALLGGVRADCTSKGLKITSAKLGHVSAMAFRDGVEAGIRAGVERVAAEMNWESGTGREWVEELRSYQFDR